MKCTNCGADNADNAKFCSECGAPLENKQEAPASWYYVKNGASTGPYTETEMANMAANGTIAARTYVWKEGMSDWQYMENSELAKYLPHQETTTFTDTARRTGATLVPNSVQPKNILLYICLSILTCGIFTLYWMYSAARDINSLADAQNKPRGVDPAMAVILFIVTCGVYGIYYFWKEGKTMAALQYPDYDQGDDTIVMVIIAFFMQTVSLVILQSDINDIISYGE